MNIRILAEASSPAEREAGAWGLSALIGNDMVFDTFSDGSLLAHRFHYFGVAPSDITRVVISHDHWDHTGGLAWLLGLNNDVTVYVCRHVSDSLKEKIRSFHASFVEIDQPMELAPGVHTTGEIAGLYKREPIFEQALIIDTPERTLLTGCAHPGIVPMLTQVLAQNPDPIRRVVGGLHMSDCSDSEARAIAKQMQSLGVERIAPLHCTGSGAVQQMKILFGKACMTTNDKGYGDL